MKRNTALQARNAEVGQSFPRRKPGFYLLIAFFLGAISACPAEILSNTQESKGETSGFQSYAPGETGSSRASVLPPEETFRVRVWTDSETYQAGDSIEIYFRADRDAFVYIFDTDPTGVTRQILPNYFDTNSFARAGHVYRIPTPDYDLQVIGPPGLERLDMVAVTRPLPGLPRSFQEFDPEDPFPAHGDGVSRILEEVRRENRRLEAAGLLDYTLPEDRLTTEGATPDVFYGFAPERDESVPEMPEDEVSEDASVSEAPISPEARVQAFPPYALAATDYTTFTVLSKPKDEGMANVTISSSPSYAAVYVNGQYVGYSPVSFRAPLGQCRIRLQKAGYFDAVRVFRVTGGRSLSFHLDLLLDSSYGSFYYSYRYDPYYPYPYRYYDSYWRFYYWDGYRNYYYRYPYYRNPYRYYYRDWYRDRYRDRDRDRYRYRDDRRDGRRDDRRDVRRDGRRDGRRGRDSDDSGREGRYRRLPEPEPPRQIEKLPERNRRVTPEPRLVPRRLEKREVPSISPPSRPRRTPSITPAPTPRARIGRLPSITPAPTPPRSRLKKREVPSLSPSPPARIREKPRTIIRPSESPLPDNGSGRTPSSSGSRSRVGKREVR